MNPNQNNELALALINSIMNKCINKKDITESLCLSEIQRVLDKYYPYKTL